MNFNNGDNQHIQINRKSHIKRAKIKENSKNKRNYKDNSAHNLFMPQCMMGVID